MKSKQLLIVFLSILILSSCKKFLDIVPDNIPTLDHAFSDRYQAEKYLFTCYSYLPQDGDVNPQMMSGGELWMPYPPRGLSTEGWQIGRGNQNIVDPYYNFWDGRSRGISLFQAIRDCNIFLENIHKASDLDEFEATRWKAEVKFLKAYYHFYLLRMYGPIPIVDKNLPISASPEEVKVFRDPVDSVVNYISNLLDSAAVDLPLSIPNPTTELGRVTKVIAKSVKARLLVMAASPLFNGNPDYINFKGKDGRILFNANYDNSKWEKAVQACRDAIDLCNDAGLKLYYFPQELANISQTTRTQMNVRGSVTEKWNSEIIWGDANNRATSMQDNSMARIDPRQPQNQGVTSELAPTMRVAETFYSENGVPISEDKEWDYNRKYETRVASASDKYNIIPGYETARLHFDREPRFYADLGFDGSIWYMQNSPTKTDTGTFNVQARAGQLAAMVTVGYYSVTGYFAKKLVSWRYVIGAGNSVTRGDEYPWPLMRLADLYLMYAESLNETQGPGSEVYKWIDSVRLRAGLKGVEESWSKYSVNPSKPNTKEGLRSIIHRERQIEFALEGLNYWDLLRWKEAANVLNTPVRGWTLEESEAAGYYRPRTIYNQVFIAPRDYFWPIRENDLFVNKNLVQNPGW
jgi:hypothetical protein